MLLIVYIIAALPVDLYSIQELSVAHCVNSEGISSESISLQSPQVPQLLSFLAINVYAKLVVLILKVTSLSMFNHVFLNFKLFVIFHPTAL